MPFPDKREKFKCQKSGKKLKSNSNEKCGHRTIVFILKQCLKSTTFKQAKNGTTKKNCKNPHKVFFRNSPILCLRSGITLKLCRHARTHATTRKHGPLVCLPSGSGSNCTFYYMTERFCYEKLVSSDKTQRDSIQT